MKARFLALAALVLGLASCQKDFDAANVGAGGEVDFQLSVAAPELATRAGVDGVTPDGQADLNSAYGAIDYLQANDEGDATLRTDWSDVNLRYTLEVYDVDENGNLVGKVPYAPVKDRQVIIVDEYQPVTFELRLVPKRHYRFVVFADFVPQTVTDGTQTSAITAQANIGLHHVIGNTLADIKVKNDGINDECSDAYFAFKDFTITNSASNDIVLKRPYGKLRVIATDLHELNLNSNPDAVKVEYTALQPQTLNAVTGEIGAIENTVTTFVSEYNEGVCKEFDEKNGKLGLQNHFYNAGYDALNGANHKQHTNANGDVRHTHMTLFTDYILATEQQHSVHFTMTVYDRENNEIKSTTFNTDIPVQRNYLTTVIGNVLTTATEVEVRIDDNFSNGTEWNPEEDDFDIELVEVDSAKTLQEALDNYVNGQTIFFVDDIEGNVTVDQVEGKDYVIDGNGYNYDGTIYIDGNSRNDGAETLTIRNINFATDKDKINFIEQNSADGAVRYPHNVTVENCSFRATGVDVIALKIRQGYNITVKDCVADGVTRANTSGMHSLGQFYGCTGITIDGVNFNAGRGVSFGTSLDVVVKNSTFVAESYGLRADASVATTLTLENVNISADLPVVARQCTADYTINISGDNTFDAPGYQIVFTKGDDETPFETPTSNWKLNGGNGLRVFPGNTALYAYDAENLQYLLNHATGNTEIHLAADIVGNVIVPEIANSTITINGRHYNFDGYFQINGKTEYEGATTVFENIEFETANSANLLDSAFIYCGTYNGDTSKRYPDNVTIKGCTFTAKDAAVHNSVGAKFWSMDGNLVIEDCAANGLHSLVQLTSCSTADVTIDRVGIVNGKNGISLGDAKLSYIKNTNIASNEYGIRANGTGEYTLNLENVNIKAAKPVIVRNASKNYTVNFTGDNTLETSGYQVIFTTGSDDATFVAPDAYTLIGGDDFRVFPEPATASTWDEFTAAINNGNKEIKLTADITYSGNYSLQKNVSINLNGNAITMPMLYLFSTATIKNGTINGKVYARTNSDVVLDTVVFSGEVSDNLSTEGHLAIQGGCNVYAKNCVFDATTVNGSQTRSLSIEGRSSGTLKFEGCDFKFRSFGTGSAKYKKQVYVNTLSGNATLDFTRCKFNSKAPNIMFAATYPFTNFTMSDCDNTAPTLEINRAKDAVTEADWTYLSTMIANNSYSQIRIFYAGGTSEYFK